MKIFCQKSIHQAAVLSVVLVLLLLGGCAAPKADLGPVFWPPLPEDPRVQFLTTINGSEDIGKKDSDLKIIVTGKTEEEKELSIFKPYGVAVNKGKIYVCDLTGRIAVIDVEKEQFDFLDGTKLSGIKKPVNVAFDSDDNIYVADSMRQQILVFRADGRFLRELGTATD